MTNEKQQYDFDLRLDKPVNVHAIQFGMVPQSARVLDVGCHTGLLGEALTTKKQCEVVGIDNDPAAIRIAATRLRAAYPTDLESETWVTELRENEPEAFDVIIFGDVLEHTRNPEHILEQARVLLKPHGRIIVSLPNIVNLRVRLKILLGNFEYEESGILDRTHLRFFTKASAKAMIERAGYRVLDSEVSGYSLPRGLIRMFPGLLAVQFVNAAEPIERNS